MAENMIDKEDILCSLMDNAEKVKHLLNNLVNAYKFYNCEPMTSDEIIIFAMHKENMYTDLRIIDDYADKVIESVSILNEVMP